MKLPILSLSTFLLAGVAFSPIMSMAQNTDGYKDTPLVPGTKWHVHDPDRPQPVKVTAPGCLTTQPPSDAEILFNGTSTDAWQPSPNKPTEKYKPRMWPIKDGIWVDSYNSIETKKGYGDCQLHIEWRVPISRSASGQRGANSGVMFMGGRYEIQVLESHSNITYADGTAGAIYGQFPPMVNPALPKGEWQSYDIAFVAPRFDKDGKLISPAKFTVLFNGVLVQNAQELLGPTTWKNVPPWKAHPERLPLILQFHGDPIEFRNIWIRDLEKDAKASEESK
ncbi:MAG: DUF1080 domain-containing protein [Puniceicoccales bacterium]|nr:DUF1080 domain-containing protein [Puniceicoccales bacterium]